MWFHVDNMSSAHVYCRCPEGYSWDSIPQEVLDDCAQLTKANSIAGNKKDNVTVIYTPWANLRKDGSMDVGQVSFTNAKQVQKVHVRTRQNAIVNRLNKTKKELYPDLEQERIDYEKLQRLKYAEEHRQRQKVDLEQSREYRKLAEQKDKAYSALFDDEVMRHSSNQFRADDWEDDFM